MIVSGVVYRDSAIHTHVSILTQTPLPSRLPHNIEQSSLCYTVGPCWLSILNIAVCTCWSQSEVKLLSHIRLWTVDYQAFPSIGFSRQEYQSGLPFPSPGHLPDPGIEPRSSALQADTLPSEPHGKPVDLKLPNYSFPPSPYNHISCFFPKSVSLFLFCK